MLSYSLGRVVQGVATLLGVATVVFFISRLSGDPAALMLPPDATEETLRVPREPRPGPPHPAAVRGLHRQPVAGRSRHLDPEPRGCAGRCAGEDAGDHQPRAGLLGARAAPCVPVRRRRAADRAAVDADRHPVGRDDPRVDPGVLVRFDAHHPLRGRTAVGARDRQRDLAALCADKHHARDVAAGAVHAPVQRLLQRGERAGLRAHGAGEGPPSMGPMACAKA